MLWLIVASTLLTPFWLQTAVKPFSGSHFKPEQEMLALLLLLASLTLILTIRHQGMTKKMAHQAQHNKETIKQLKKQHQAEAHQIQTLMGNEQFAYWEWHIKNNRAQFSAQWKKMVGLPGSAELTNLHDLQNRIHPKTKPPFNRLFFKF